ncbi:MAG: CBS domain-containing protein [Gammaproteobacteria bacterium]|nr:CBS domain-containing protein [Gammaproteobacteria bacterium]NIM73140.1 CBS domain-containing protein [Gammaproteobacteria bacterium]NIN38820.1 CBS domain-containing protein [Gammaproteobacteria bacterium]NIO24895.1 CBS domain-containing protein [Gammaproteobacteria bacterium]NIO65497.1 CBS domain-containing protein [Gammaproteobacteria bacterium]
MNIAEHFTIQQVERLDLFHYCRVASGCTVEATLKKLNDSDSNCAFVMQQTRLVGIFTDRDVLRKVVDTPQRWADPIDSVMTRTPRTVSSKATAMDALQLMNGHRFRNVPVMDERDTAVGNLTHFSLMRFANTLVRNEMAREESEPSVQHSLSLVNLSGLMSAEPITVTAEATLRECIETMRKRDIGLLMIVDDDGRIVGVFSERDVMTKIACKIDKLESERVGSFMSPDVIKLWTRDSIAAALHHMAQSRIRRLPLVTATGQPTGVISFRDIAAYIETSFAM